mgnify:CR=1 FL=1|jgi:serine/threonine protein phosphatase PrpC
MQITSFGTTDRGRVRQANEDALLIDGAHQLYAVADGLGGLPGGAEASHRIVELLGQAMRRVDSTEERIDLSELMTRIHRIVSKEGLEAQIREKLMQASTPEDACKSLTRMANDHQGPDNITLIVLHIT